MHQSTQGVSPLIEQLVERTGPPVGQCWTLLEDVHSYYGTRYTPEALDALLLESLVQGQDGRMVVRVCDQLAHQQRNPREYLEELDLLRTRYLTIVTDLRQQWWECSRQGQGNSDLAKFLWGMRSMLEHLARDMQVAQEDRDLHWLQAECEIHYRCRLRDLTPEWAQGQPSWFLWSSRRQAAIFRLTRQITAKACKDEGKA